MNNKDIIEWAYTQKRVTTRRLQERFDIEYEEAAKVYKCLKDAGVIMSTGYVIKEGHR